MTGWRKHRSVYKLSQVERAKRARREKIATAVLAGIISQYAHYEPRTLASVALNHADALIAELDKDKDKPGRKGGG